jgi:hypothetical protein
MTTETSDGHVCGENADPGDYEYDHAAGEVYQQHTCAVCGHAWWQNAYHGATEPNFLDLA